MDSNSFLQATANCIRLVGRESDEKELLKLVYSASSEAPLVISVCGFPGLGKSALVRSIFQNHSGNHSEKYPFDQYFWVDVSYPFSFIKLCRRMHSFMLQQGQVEFGFMPKESEPDEDIIKGCTAFLQNFRCLLVIDGLRSMEEWVWIKSLTRLPSTSRILVVTAENEIAKYCVQRDDAIYEVRALSLKEAFTLFEKVPVMQSHTILLLCNIIYPLYYFNRFTCYFFSLFNAIPHNLCVLKKKIF